MEEWEPHTVTTTETIDPGPVAALAALLDDGLPTPAAGDLLPPLWHWVALPRWPVSTLIDTDGHPKRGSFLPPIDLPRRMFAGGELLLHSGLRVGQTVRRESVVESVTEKTGRTGKLVIVVVRTRLYGTELAVEERQDLIYREAGIPTPALESDTVAALTPVGSPFGKIDESCWEFRTDPTLLMRFSAATANAHRIHYDWPYATRIEGYPGLVVHGPLMTLALAETIRLQQHSARVTRLVHRNQAPMFCGQRARVHLRATPDGHSVELSTPDGPRTRIDVESQLDGTAHA